MRSGDPVPASVRRCVRAGLDSRRLLGSRWSFAPLGDSRSSAVPTAYLADVYFQYRGICYRGAEPAAAALPASFGQFRGVRRRNGKVPLDNKGQGPLTYRHCTSASAGRRPILSVGRRREEGSVMGVMVCRYRRMLWAAAQMRHQPRPATAACGGPVTRLASPAAQGGALSAPPQSCNRLGASASEASKEGMCI